MSGSLAVPKYFQHKKIQNLAVGIASAEGWSGLLSLSADRAISRQ